MIGQALTLLAVGMQSAGGVLYGTFLADVPTPLFLLISFCLTACVFLCAARFRFPAGGLFHMALVNLWTTTGFVGMFFALKYLPPSVFASVEMGAALITAVAVTAFATRSRPAYARAVACLGIVGGCVLLCWVELSATVAAPTAMLWLAFAACIAAGLTSTLMIETCRALNAKGWTCSSILAHRFYLTIAVAVAWLVWDPTPDVQLATGSLGLVALVGAFAVLAPALLFQMALKRVDTVSVMVCAAAQPVISFVLALPSPSYSWSWKTLAGVAVVSLCVLCDVAVTNKIRFPRLDLRAAFSARTLPFAVMAAMSGPRA